MFRVRLEYVVGARTSPLHGRSARWLVRLFSFRRPRASEDVHHSVVSFVAGVLEERSRGTHRHRYGPGPSKSRGVLDRKLIVKRFGVDSSKSFNESQILRGPPQCAVRIVEGVDAREQRERSVGEVNRFDNERVSFPMPTRIAHPLS